MNEQDGDFGVCAGDICIILAEHAFGADGSAIPLEALNTAFGNHVWKFVRVNSPFRGRENDSGFGNADRRRYSKKDTIQEERGIRHVVAEHRDSRV